MKCMLNLKREGVSILLPVNEFTFSSSSQEQVVNADDNQVYGDYHNGPEYSFAVDNNLHYDGDVPAWEGAMVTDKNQHYE